FHNNLFILSLSYNLKPMSRKYKRVAVYPADLKRWSGKSDSAVYRDYCKVQETLGLNKDVVLTIYHFRDLLKITLDDVVDGFSLGEDGPDS
ncbi:MAG TPA: hypothetical protein VFM79_12770, partial [Pelobium sp.]|nr:hypothetical protein [Pelobium sp.]